MELIDTSIIYKDGSKREQYTDTGDMKTAKFHVVPYDFCSDLNRYVDKYYLVYERAIGGSFGMHLGGNKVKHSSLEGCINEIQIFLGEN